MKKLGIFLLSLFASVTALAQTTTLYPPAFGWYSYTPVTVNGDNYNPKGVVPVSAPNADVSGLQAYGWLTGNFLSSTCSFQTSLLNVTCYGAKLDGLTDDIVALNSAVSASNSLWAASSQRTCIYVPATHPTMYINGSVSIVNFSRYYPGCVDGDGGDVKSVIQMGSNFTGDLFAWSDVFVSANGQTSALNSPLVSAGPTVRNIEVFGYKGGSWPASSSIQNAFMMYDAIDFAYFDNVGCFWISGSCISGGRIKNNTFSFIRESMLNNIRINKTGNTTTPKPNIDIYSDCTGICIGGTNADYKNGSNQIDIVNVRDYAAETTGISIINNNQNTGANARKIRVVNLTIEGDQTQASPQQTGYLLQLGSTSALGKYNSVYITNAHFLSPYDGYGDVLITSGAGLIPYDIRCESCGIETGAGASGGRSGTALGLNIQSGYNIYWKGSDLTSPGINVTVGPTSGGVGVSGQITIDGEGAESGYTTNIDPTAAPYVQSVVYKSGLGAAPTFNGSQSVSAWLNNGVGLVGGTATFNDATSSGTVASNYIYNFPSPTVTATSTTTYTNEYAFHFPVATCSTNVTCTNNSSAKFDGGALFLGLLQAQLGSTINGGTISLNGSSNYNTNLNTGTSTGTLTLGGSSASVVLGAPPKLPAFTVSGLPTCNTAAKGEMAYVTDANAPSYNGALTGSSTTIVPVFCNGTAWTSH